MLAEWTKVPSRLRDDGQGHATTRGVHGDSVEEIDHSVYKEKCHQNKTGIEWKRVSFDKILWDVSHRPYDGGDHEDAMEVGDWDHDECNGHS